MNKVWQISSDFIEEKKELQWTEWDVNITIYNPLSGDTCLLNLFPFEILKFLLEKPALLYDISKYSAVLCDEEHNEQWDKKILAILEDLRFLELIDY